MKRPPDDPRDENPPQTRPFDPDVDPASMGDPTAQYPAGEYPTGAYPPPGPAGSYPDGPPPSAAYSQQPPPGAGYGYGPGPYDRPYDQGYGDQNYPGQGYPADDPYGAPPPDGRQKSRRTAGLVLAVLAALAVVVVAAVLILNNSRNGGSGSVASSTASPPPASTTTTTTTTEATTTTTEPTTTTTTTRQTPAGSVVYQLTGNGDVVALQYRSGARSVIVPATSSPWSQSTQVDGGNAEVTAIVVRGPVTCTILQGEQLLASSTSRGGPLRCAATLPE